jgi:Ca2+-binding RTX toxin-like protein
MSIDLPQKELSMSIFLGSNAGETITPETVSSSVKVIGGVKKPSAAADIIFAGGGNDVVAGGGGTDIVSLGSGDDTFIWNGGDGGDVITGDGGFDTLKFNGADLNEQIEISSLLGAVALKGTVDLQGKKQSSTLALDSMERLELATLGGTDKIHVKNLSGTDVKEVAIDLGGVKGGMTSDGAIDQITADATSKADVIEVLAQGSSISVVGLPTLLSIKNADANDQLTIKGGGGADLMSASTVASGSMQFTFDGGAGNDEMHGSAGIDTFLGGAGDDLIDGGRGNDIAFMGAGDDRFVWDPGEGSDVVEGGEGFDIMEFNGNGADETIEVSSTGERSTFFRNVGNITMDLNDVERATFNALGGADTVIVHAVNPWDIREVEISLAGELFGTSGDGAVDTIVVEGGNDFDIMSIGGSLDLFSVDSGTAYVGVVHAEAQDKLVVQAFDGDDWVIAHPFTPGGINLTLDGGAGDDFILGSDGVETTFGGDGNDFVDGNGGNDIAFLGAGDDEFLWDPGEGSDVAEGGEGFDTMTFNGAGANEIVDISANGERAKFFRQPGNITMDLNDVERVTFNALGGTDDITVRDTTGTDLQEVKIDLAGELLGTTSDGQVDTVTIEGSSEADQIDVLAFNGGLATLGTSAFITIDHFDATDRVVLSGGDGDDKLSASSAIASTIQLVFDGGVGDDEMSGSSGADTFVGGAGDDFVTGNRGDDVAHLGAGDDFFIWNPGDGSDTIEGGEGTDFMGFRGANVAENVNIVADGERVKMFRDVANVTMDLNDVERMTFNAFGGTDNITIGDLTGTDMRDIELSLLLSGRPNDGERDSISVAGSEGNDAIDLSTKSLQTSIDGLAAHISISGVDAGLDGLTIDAGAGDDAINASGLTANLFQFSILGGDGNDAITGSNGDDTVDGGVGDDILSGEDGDDTLAGGDGFDIIIGGAGDDTFLNGELILDFVAGAGSEDRIDLRDLDLSFDWIINHASDTDGGALLDFGDSEVLLSDVLVGSLHQDDFLLA